MGRWWMDSSWAAHGVIWRLSVESLAVPGWHVPERSSAIDGSWARSGARANFKLLGPNVHKGVSDIWDTKVITTRDYSVKRQVAHDEPDFVASRANNDRIVCLLSGSILDWEVFASGAPIPRPLFLLWGHCV